jgi:hypothetical protein
MQLVLNCEEVSQQLKLRPHFDSIKKLFNLNQNEISFENTVI